MDKAPADKKKAELKVRELESRKLDLQAQIVSLKAEVFKVDRDLHQAGASIERINQLMRW
jgi:hypothetical protein